MNLQDLIPLLPPAPVISIAGAGGKTTLMFRLAGMLPGPCVMTTTAKVGADQIRNADRCYTLAGFPPEKAEKRMWVSPSPEEVAQKITGCSPDEFSRLAAVCRDAHFGLINEADGAACRHIKAPAAHEPAIPPESEICIYAVGLDVLGKRIESQTVHRPELFAAVTGREAGSVIDEECIRSLFEHPQGGLKNMPENALKIAYMTHANPGERRLSAERIAAELKSYDCICINE